MTTVQRPLTDEQARAVVAYWRRSDDVAHGVIDWNAVASNELGGFTGPVSARGDRTVAAWCQGIATRMRRAVQKGDLPLYQGAPVSYETAGAVLIYATNGRAETPCLSQLSPYGKHYPRLERDGLGGGLWLCGFCAEAVARG